MQSVWSVRFVATVTFPSTPKKPTPAGSGATASFSRIVGSPSAFPAIDFEKGVVWCQAKTGKELAPSQEAALRQALSSRALIITGGPGMVLGNLIDSGEVPACASFLRQRDVNSC
ncbi:MAG: hypothetical protein ABSF95_00515 [Verrucomicrobiota bacterium]|jgi:hypothetical protein